MILGADPMMTQATNDSGPRIGKQAIRRNGLAIAILGAALVAHAVLLPTTILPICKGGSFFAFYIASRAPLTGHSPYDKGGIDYEHPALREPAQDFFDSWGMSLPKAGERWIGLIYPPQAYLLFYPFSRLPWYPALACWTAFLTLAVLACGSVTWTSDPELRGRSSTVAALVIVALQYHRITEWHFSQGQSTLIMCAAVLLGQRARRAGYFWLAAFFWSFAAIKPQLGFLLLALTLLVGGWRFCAATALMTVALNALGGLLVTGDPLMILGMWKGGMTHIAHLQNTARNQGVVSWARDVYLLTGYEIAMTPARSLACLSLWTALALGAAWPRGGLRWSLPYWLAVAATGSLLIGLTHFYDMVLLILLVPYIFWLYDRGHRGDWILLTALIATATIPRRAAAILIGPGMVDKVFACHYALIIVIIAIYLLIRGQPGDARLPVIAGPGPASGIILEDGRLTGDQRR
jgi:hypothetical protein